MKLEAKLDWKNNDWVRTHLRGKKASTLNQRTVEAPRLGEIQTQHLKNFNRTLLNCGIMLLYSLGHTAHSSQDLCTQQFEPFSNTTYH